MTRAVDDADELARALVAIATAKGASSVVVMIGLPDGVEHSAYAARGKGRCLEVRGLLETGAETIRAAIAYPDKAKP